MFNVVFCLQTWSKLDLSLGHLSIRAPGPQGRFHMWEGAPEALIIYLLQHAAVTQYSAADARTAHEDDARNAHYMLH